MGASIHSFDDRQNASCYPKVEMHLVKSSYT